MNGFDTGLAKKGILLDLILPASCWSEQPYFLAKVGKRTLRIVPDPGATTSWVLTDKLVAKQTLKHPNCWSELHGFDVTTDSSALQYPDLPPTDVQHDGFRGNAIWVTENFQICSQQPDNANIFIPNFKIRLMQTFKSTYSDAFLNYEGLLGLGMAQGHRTESNWLLRACLLGMKPIFAFQCGLPFKQNPKIAFGRCLPLAPDLSTHYFRVQSSHDVDIQGSHWFIRVSGIVWKCKREEKTHRIDQLNLSYAAAWKNRQPRNSFLSRHWSTAWFDMGYPTIVLPSTQGNGDAIEIQKLMADLKAGNLGVIAGTAPLPIIRDEIQLEYIGFEFDSPCNTDGSPLGSDSKTHMWCFTVNDMLTKDNQRIFEVEIENKNVDRKCIIIGLPFAKKFSVEYHFDPSLYSQDCKHIKGQEMLGFQRQLDS